MVAKANSKKLLANRVTLYYNNYIIKAHHVHGKPAPKETVTKELSNITEACISHMYICVDLDDIDVRWS